MPNTKWSRLSSMQIGRYAEYYAKMEFASYGFDVYTSEVDDHGVDFVAKSPKSNIFYEVQVKATRKYNPVFISRSKMPELKKERLVCYLHFEEGHLPNVFVIPSTAWTEGGTTLVYYKYDKPGQKSEPEYAINVSAKNLEWLRKYDVDMVLETLE